MRRILCAALVALALGWDVVPAHGAPAQNVARWKQESTTIADRLQQLEREVVQGDTILARMDLRLGADLMAAMLAADPELAALAPRLPELEAQARVARESGDSASAAAFERSIQEIQARYLRGQQAAVREPALAAQIRVFDALVRQRMEEADGDARLLWTRLRKLEGWIARSEGRAPPD